MFSKSLMLRVAKARPRTRHIAPICASAIDMGLNRAGAATDLRNNLRLCDDNRFTGSVAFKEDGRADH